MPDDTHRALVTGDRVTFQPTFGDATIVPKSGELTGTASKLHVAGAHVCVEGDEAKVSVAGVDYLTATFAAPGGKGTLTIKPLDGGHVSETLHDGGKPVLLQGGAFDAIFTVDTPAKTADQKAADVKGKTYEGRGTFTISGDRKLFGA